MKASADISVRDCHIPAPAASQPVSMGGVCALPRNGQATRGWRLQGPPHSRWHQPAEATPQTANIDPLRSFELLLSPLESRHCWRANCCRNRGRQRTRTRGVGELLKDPPSTSVQQVCRLWFIGFNAHLAEIKGTHLRSSPSRTLDEPKDLGFHRVHMILQSVEDSC